MMTAAEERAQRVARAEDVYAEVRWDQWVGRLRRHVGGDCPECCALPHQLRPHEVFAKAEHFSWRCGATLRLCLGEDPDLEVIVACPSLQASRLECLVLDAEREAVDEAMAQSGACLLPEDAEDETPGDRRLADAERQVARDKW